MKWPVRARGSGRCRLCVLCYFSGYLIGECSDSAKGFPSFRDLSYWDDPRASILQFFLIRNEKQLHHQDHRADNTIYLTKQHTRYHMHDYIFYE